MKIRNQVVRAARCGLLVLAMTAADAQTPDVLAKIAARAAQLQAMGKEPKVVEAVKAYNAAHAASRTMTEDQWKKLTLLDPAVRALSKNSLGLYLKSKQDAAIGEMFVSGSDGGKVAFLSKTTSWCHKGKPKHEVPMTGKLWTGKPETDESSGFLMVQVGIPVIDAGKPVGSLVVGLKVAELK